MDSVGMDPAASTAPDATEDSVSATDDADLMAASQAGSITGVVAALKGGADIDQIGEGGNNAALLAAMSGHEQITELLVQAGTTISTRNHRDDTVMHWAAYRGWTCTIDLLLERYADTDVIGDLGNTPLHLAASRNLKQVVFQLIAARAACGIKNMYGHTAADLTTNSTIASTIARVHTGGKEAREAFIQEMEAARAKEEEAGARPPPEEEGDAEPAETVLSARERRALEDQEEDRLAAEEAARLAAAEAERQREAEAVRAAEEAERQRIADEEAAAAAARKKAAKKKKK